MSQDHRRVPVADRVTALGVLTLAAVLGVAAPLTAIPWALQSGWQAPRFLAFAAAVVAAWGLGIAAALPVVRKLRG
ncbi:MAG: hypothetical protein ACK47B_03925 [Armatimonadota bacterium]